VQVQRILVSVELDHADAIAQRRSTQLGEECLTAGIGFDDDVDDLEVVEVSSPLVPPRTRTGDAENWVLMMPQGMASDSPSTRTTNPRSRASPRRQSP
jgi:hypothetical protein